VVPRIAWVDEESATGPVADLYAEARAREGLIPDIAMTFRGRPEALQGMMALCRAAFQCGRSPAVILGPAGDRFPMSLVAISQRQDFSPNRR
jgi:hypothetical protein